MTRVRSIALRFAYTVMLGAACCACVGPADHPAPAAWNASDPFAPVQLRIYPLTHVERGSGPARLVCHFEFTEKALRGALALTRSPEVEHRLRTILNTRARPDGGAMVTPPQHRRQGIQHETALDSGRPMTVTLVTFLLKQRLDFVAKKIPARVQTAYGDQCDCHQDPNAHAAT